MSSNELCLDNNIYISYFSKVETLPVIDELFLRIQRDHHVLYAPALLNFEFGQVISMKSNLHDLSDEDQQIALSLFFRLPILIQWNEDIMKLAADLVHQKIGSFYDTSYLAVAISRQIPLITMDKDLYKKARKVYQGVFLPEQWV